MSAAVLFYVSGIVASDDGRMYQGRERHFLTFKAGRAFRREFDACGGVVTWVEYARRRDLQAPRDAAGIWPRLTA